MAIIPVKSEHELDALLEQADSIDDPTQQVGFLSQYYLDLPISMPPDPFSRDYIDAVVRTYMTVCKRSSYEQTLDELMPADALKVGVGQPQPFAISDSSWVGDSWIAWGFIMRVLKLRRGQRVIEYGPGWGSLALALARNGCDVTVVDVEPGYLKWIEHQAKQVDAHITTLRGTFGERPLGSRPYDAVVFLESFHHCLPHAELLVHLKAMTSDKGVVCLGDEPVFDQSDYWAPTVPFPWGPRLDLVSIRSGRRLGWMELGFQESYVIDMLWRAGWVPEKHVCPLTRRGTCYVGRKTELGVSVGTALLPFEHDSTWHQQEATGRWTRGESTFPLPISKSQSEVLVELVNHNIKPCLVCLRCGNNILERVLEPGITT